MLELIKCFRCYIGLFQELFTATKLCYRILKLLNQRKLEAFKEKWWNKNPNKKKCEEFEEDSGGGISIYNIGKFT